MRIQVINGNTFEAMTQGIDEAAQAAKFATTEIVTTQSETGPESIEGFYDEYLAIPGILATIAQSESAFDGFIIACWGDPGVDAAREMTCKPVVGIAEASMYMANMVAARWGVVTTGHRVLDMIEHTIHRTGFSHRCVSIRTTGLAVVETETARQATLEALHHMGKLAIDEDKAEALCLGCAGMSGLDRQLEERLSIPVIDGVAAAVKMVESLVSLHKKTSKALTYRSPELKSIKGYPDYMQPSNLPRG